MPFDGREYQRLPMIPPIGAHSNANGTGEVLASSLRASYMALRWRARLIGIQTYPIYQRFIRSNGIEVSSFISAAWVDVARFEDAQIPAWATHITARLTARVMTSAPLTLFVRATIDDGVDQDTGDATEVPLVPLTGYPHRVIFSVWGRDDAVTNALCTVPIVDARVNPGPLGARTVKVQAYAVNADSAAQEIQPGLVTAWWEARA